MATDYSAIQNELEKFQNAVYGEEIRSSLISSIKQCYSDMEKGKLIQVSKFSSMTEKNCIYVYVGSEPAHKDEYGHWFYYDAEADVFVSGGSMGGTSELTIEGSLFSLVYGSNF